MSKDREGYIVKVTKIKFCTKMKFFIPLKSSMSCLVGKIATVITVKLWTDRGIRGGGGDQGIWFCGPTPEFFIRQLLILETFALSFTYTSLGKDIFLRNIFTDL